MSLRRQLASLWLVAIAAWTGAAAWAVTIEPDTPGIGRDRKQGVSATPAHIAALVGKLGEADWQARDQAMRELIAMGDAARKALEGALASPDAEVRWRASHALSKLDTDLRPPDPDPARTLYESAAKARAQKEGHDAARRLYGEVIERFADTPWGRAARERLAELLAEETAAREPPPDERSIARLLEQLGSAAWSERQAASVRLAALGAKARATLEAAAQSGDPETAWRARRLLARLGQPEKAADEEPEVRIRMAPGLRGFDAPGPKVQPPAVATHIDGLVRSLRSQDANEAAIARDTLEQMGRDAVGALVRGLDGSDEVAGVEIMDLLQQITGEKLGFSPKRWQAWWRALGRQGKD